MKKEDHDRAYLSYVKSSYGISAFYLLTLFLAVTVNANNTVSSEGYSNAFATNWAIALAAPQERTVQGLVSDETGQPLPGATVQIKGTSSGVTTDFDGNFSIEVSGDAVLVVSYLGYATKEVAVANQSTVNVSLEPDASQLDEVFVVGYGTTAKKDVTGAISSVDGDDFKNLPVASVDKVLQGRLAGVQVVNNGGAPGAGASIRIRGTGTVNNSDPLYVIDGVPTGSIAGINQNNIESIEVLKDASASAIYGTRAANGVVIITTKKGRRGQKTEMTLDAYTGFSNVVKTIDVLEAPALAEIKRERYANDGIPVDEIWNDSQYLTQRTNWQNELFRTGTTQNVDLTITGSSEKSSFLFGLGYYDEQGVIEKAKANRLSLQMNSDHRITDWLKIEQNLSLSTRADNGFNTTSAQTGLIWSAIRFHPGLPVRNADGSYSSSQVSSEFGDINNPMYTVNIDDAKDRKTRILSNVAAEISFTPELKFKANFGVDAEIRDQRSYDAQILDQIRQRGTSSRYRGYEETYSFLMEYFLSYNKVFGDHVVGGVAGYTEQSFDSQGFNARTYNVESAESQKLLTNGDADTAGEFRSHDGLKSIFGRLNYSYKDKYLVTATLRSDESSRFAEGNQRGTFPAFSLGWRVSEESFFDIPLISDLKLTGGWGELGNQNISRLQYLARLSGGRRYSFGLDGSNQVEGVAQASYANPDVTWETVVMSNFGLNIGFADNRLTTNFNYFIKNTEDMLLQPPAIGSQGTISSPFQNVGEVENKGLEIELNWQDNKGDLSYGVGANASFVKNKVIKLVDGNFLASSFYGRPNQELSRTFEGEPIATFFGWKTNGLFQTQADIDGHATQEGAVPGDVQFVDINEDGVIDDQDRTIIGSPHPDMTYGINANIAYKGFDVTAFFLGAAGVDIYNADRMQGLDASYPFNVYSDIEGRWTGAGTSNSIPRVSTLRTNLNHRTSDMFVESGDYFRLKNLTIGYSLPVDYIEKINLSRLRLYVTAQNLFTITGYSGMDPELGLTDGNLQQNVDFAQFPQARTFLLGVNLSF
ncbi:SusC/RagA family TonB-linked outer membrane protein [Kriegella aquimaris]|uniref:TonB-linked outer membrane protein, SusC/RagA family n=1 Tax=Kriegella aquimaris TaxID=192904 RepID=A0A1G9TKW3_9FLAO|nr:TonB-dependent receptor [Kriegella aquimaris]SDM48262.1 TonB-linked outer membrane protein, SusC/RagA family [Kriegella aquimaris]